MVFSLAFEFVEQWIDHQGLEEENEQQDGQRNEPEVKPPALRGFADHGIQKPYQNGAENNTNELAFGPIPKPRSPALDGKAVLPRDPVFVDAGGQLEDIDRENCQRRKEEGLEKALREFVLGQDAVFGGELRAQHEPEDHQAIDKADQRETKMNLREIVSLLVAIWRKGVFGDFLRRRRL